MSGVRLAARTAAAAGAMSKFSGTTCLQEGEEARWAHSLHTDLPKHCTHKPRETAEEGFGKKEKATDFHTNNLDRADWDPMGRSTTFSLLTLPSITHINSVRIFLR